VETLYPGARVKLLPEALTQPRITPRQIILHTNGGTNTATPAQLYAYLARADVTIESHFDVGTDGAVWQFMPIDRRADANLAANAWAVSIETQDNGGGAAGVAATPWSRAQCASLVALLHWLGEVAGIPMQRARAYDAPGVGAHRDYPEWSASAHSCPGDARAAQVPMLIAAAGGPIGDDELPAEILLIASDGTELVWFPPANTLRWVNDGNVAALEPPGSFAATYTGELPNGNPVDDAIRSLITNTVKAGIAPNDGLFAHAW
jgi:N-acetylmuramoyl-L-alanine amidase